MGLKWMVVVVWEHTPATEVYIYNDEDEADLKWFELFEQYNNDRVAPISIYKSMIKTTANIRIKEEVR